MKFGDNLETTVEEIAPALTVITVLLFSTFCLTYIFWDVTFRNWVYAFSMTYASVGYFIIFKSFYLTVNKPLGLNNSSTNKEITQRRSEE